MLCGWCSTPLVGRQAKWCSDNCRKRGCDDTHRASCLDCGAALTARSGFRVTAHLYERCRACWTRHVNAAHRTRIEDAVEMYREGMTHTEIAAALGYGPNSRPPEITEARRLGLIDGYRLPPERVQKMRSARWGEAA